MLDASKRGGACSAQAFNDAGAVGMEELAVAGESAISVRFCALFSARLSRAIAGLCAGSVIPRPSQSSSYLSDRNTSRSAVLLYAKAKSGTDSIPVLSSARQRSGGTCMLASRSESASDASLKGCAGVAMLLKTAKVESLSKTAALQK